MGEDKGGGDKINGKDTLLSYPPPLYPLPPGEGKLSSRADIKFHASKTARAEIGRIAGSLGRGKNKGGMTNKLTNLAKILRKKSTDAESLLWQRLRARQLEGIKFRRQQPIGTFIVDFVTFEKQIVIEVDGGQHTENRYKDAKRDGFLTASGFKVLRFWNNEVLDNMDGVLEKIGESCLQ